MVKRSGLDRIWTVPNAISIGRLGLLGAFAGVLFSTDDHLGAFIVLAVAGTTDFLDGYIARRFHQVSKIGQLLDPTVDRVVVTTAVIALTVYGAIPVWLGVLILSREVTIIVFAAVLASLHAEPIPVKWVGKAGTFGLMCALPLFILGDGTSSAARAVHDIAWVLTVPAITFAYSALFAYVSPALRSLSNARSASLDTKA